MICGFSFQSQQGSVFEKFRLRLNVRGCYTSFHKSATHSPAERKITAFSIHTTMKQHYPILLIIVPVVTLLYKVACNNLKSNSDVWGFSMGVLAYVIGMDLVLSRTLNPKLLEDEEDIENNRQHPAAAPLRYLPLIFEGSQKLTHVQQHML